MKKNISIACNWDNELLEFVRGKKIYSMYGKLRNDFLGGGRTPHEIKKITLDEVKVFIDQLHRSNIKFIYLINSTCNGNMEYTSEFENKIVAFVKDLIDCGVDLFCVSNLFTGKLLRKNFPDIKLEVSALSFVRTPAQAKIWDDLGVAEICLCQSINHDLEMIKAIKESVKAELKLLVNDPCIINCPMAHLHANYWSHSGVSHPKIKDYCNHFCSKKFIQNPAEIIKSSFILPENLQLYEDVGVSHFKVVDRLMPTSFLIKAYNAYANESYDGSVYDLFPFYKKLKEVIPDFKIMMGSKSLANIRRHLRKSNCRLNCGNTCNYCEQNSTELYTSENTKRAIDYLDMDMDR